MQPNFEMTDDQGIAEQAFNEPDDEVFAIEVVKILLLERMIDRASRLKEEGWLNELNDPQIWTAEDLEFVLDTYELSLKERFTLIKNLQKVPPSRDRDVVSKRSRIMSLFINDEARERLYNAANSAYSKRNIDE